MKLSGISTEYLKGAPNLAFRLALYMSFLLSFHYHPVAEFMVVGTSFSDDELVEIPRAAVRLPVTIENKSDVVRAVSIACPDVDS